MDNIVRIGKVVDVDIFQKCCRVYYEDQKIVSGWLKVAQHSGAGVYGVPDAAPSVGVWMPHINDQVLCLYYAIADGDGFILGGL